MADFLQQHLLFGLSGLDLTRPLDEVPPTHFSRMSNVIRSGKGGVTGRLGQKGFSVSSTPVTHHSIGRLNDPRAGSAQALVIMGADTKLYSERRGRQLLEEGFSGDPLTMVPYRPPLSGDTWMVVADRTKMRKVRASDGLTRPLGLAMPVASDRRFRIDEFGRFADGAIGGADRMRFSCFGFDLTEAGPGAPGDLTNWAATRSTVIHAFDSAAASVTNNAGTGGAPTCVDDPSCKEGTAALKITTAIGSATANYYNFVSLAATRDLSRVSGFPASDDDLMHLWLKCDRPDLLTEIRVYLVVGAFDLTTVPGTSATLNTDAYFKAFRASDLTKIYEVGATVPTAWTSNVTRDVLDKLASSTDDRASVEFLLQQRELSRSRSEELAPGRAQWTEFGNIGLPLHRRDFRRVGTNSALTWADVSGLVIVISVSTNQSINVWLDDFRLTGGYGLDSTAVGRLPYDFRYINYDPRTGDRSNPSPVQSPGYRLDAMRQGIVIQPKAYGDPAIRQRFFQRGGTLVDNWYFIGENTADGQAFTATDEDAKVLSSNTLEIDNDECVTTVDANGTTVHAQPLPSVWGPVNDLIFGCGDPYRPGHLYWSKAQIIGSWPSTNNYEVCSPSEELMAGGVFAGAPFVFSRERLYTIQLSAAASSVVITTPTPCTKGLVSRWGLAVGFGGIYFVGDDGIYRTAGSLEESLTDATLWPLFHGEEKNGFLPVDFSVPEAIRLTVHNNELWFLYRDTGGTNHVLVYSILNQYWYSLDFGREPACVYSEEGNITPPSLLIGGRSTGKVYQYAGTDDDGLAISASFRTGALNQGLPRENKLYGDAFLELDRQGNSVLVTPRTNKDETTLATSTLASGTGLQFEHVAIDDGVNDMALGRTLSLEVSWATTGTPPVIFRGGPSYIPEPPTTELRVTSWDSQGALSDKYVKGILLECDTYGQDKVLDVQVDGSTLVTLTINASGRRVVEKSFRQVLGRLLRIRPDTTTHWTLYSHQWIFDEEPLALDRWETQFLTHGFAGAKTPLYGHITLRSTATVVLAIVTQQQDGTTAQKDYLLASTNGEKVCLFVPFEATRGTLLQYTLTSVAPFHLYREETTIMLSLWGQGEGEVHPFGNDDKDPTRDMRSSAGSVARAGGTL